MTEQTKTRAERRREKNEKPRRLTPHFSQIWREETKKSNAGVEYKYFKPMYLDINAIQNFKMQPQKGN